MGEAATAEEAMRGHRGRAQPDVLLLDVVMPGRSGIEALRGGLTAAAPGTEVLVLSMQDDPSYVRQAFAAGATGYLLKEAADADLLQAVREVAARQALRAPAARRAARRSRVDEPTR